MKRFFITLTLLLTSPLVLAISDCPTKQTFCETQCMLKHFNDEAAELGCKSVCVAKRALCSTEKGAETAVEKGGDVIDAGVELSKDAWKNTKSFVKGATE